MWREIDAGAEWIVDADLKDYFGRSAHEKLMSLVESARSRSGTAVRGEILATGCGSMCGRRGLCTCERDSRSSATRSSAASAGCICRPRRSRRDARVGALRVSDPEVGRPVQGRGPPEDAASHTAEHRGADPRPQSCDSRVGRVLQTRPRAETLQPTRSVGGATTVVAPLSTVALCGLEDPPDTATPRRAGAGEPDWPDPFVGLAACRGAFVKAACGKTARAV